MYFIVATLLLSVVSALAQVAPTASLIGTVTDPSTAAVPTVKLVNIDTGFDRTTEVRFDGAHQFTQVPVGMYRVEAVAPGFSMFQQARYTAQRQH